LLRTLVLVVKSLQFLHTQAGSVADRAQATFDFGIGVQAMEGANPFGT